MSGENCRSTVPGGLGGSLYNTSMDIPCVGAGFPLLVSVADVVSNHQQSAVESGQDRAVRDSRPSVSERAA